MKSHLSRWCRWPLVPHTQYWKTTTSPGTYISVSSSQSHVALTLELRPCWWPSVAGWTELTPCCLLGFLHYSVCLKLKPSCYRPSLTSQFPLPNSSVPWDWLHHTKPLQELSGNNPPPSVSNLSLTSDLFFLLAPRQHWDQTQAPLSCNRDKMACVVLGFCDCRWISFLGSPNLLLGPVLNANPAGFIRPVHSIQLYLTGVVLSHSTTNCTSELMA